MKFPASLCEPLGMYLAVEQLKLLNIMGLFTARNTLLELMSAVFYKLIGHYIHLFFQLALPLKESSLGHIAWSRLALV